MSRTGKTYSGIGARDTPAAIRFTMYNAGYWLAQNGFTLRSGGARGADTEYESACTAVGGSKEIFRKHHVEHHPEWLLFAEQHHPAWHKCSPDARLLHARNSPIVMGQFLNDPVDFILCWTPGGKITGGTGQALRIAKARGIYVHNFFNDPEGLDLWRIVNAL